MSKYGVTLPLTGSIYVEVEADSEEEAIDEALVAELIVSEAEWNVCKQVVKGNVFYGELNEAEAELLDDEDEEEYDDGYGDADEEED